MLAEIHTWYGKLIFDHCHSWVSGNYEMLGVFGLLFVFPFTCLFVYVSIKISKTQNPLTAAAFGFLRFLSVAGMLAFGVFFGSAPVGYYEHNYVLDTWVDSDPVVTPDNKTYLVRKHSVGHRDIDTPNDDSKITFSYYVEMVRK